MRRLLSAIALIAVLGTSAPGMAQLVREHEAQGLRAFHGGPARIRRSFQSDAEARSIFKHILAVSGLAGLEDRIIIRASAETDAAEAFVEKDERLIFYNAEFMQAMAKKDKNYWSMAAILAHEVGHHIRFHTVIDGRNHEFELEADYQAGFILRRLGATLEQAQTAFRTLAPEQATSSHPSRAQRVQAVTLGWTDAPVQPTALGGGAGAGSENRKVPQHVPGSAATKQFVPRPGRKSCSAELKACIANCGRMGKPLTRCDKVCGSRHSLCLQTGSFQKSSGPDATSLEKR